MIQSASFENKGVDLISCPFGYVPDSTEPMLRFSSDSTASYVPFIGKPCHQNDNYDSKKIEKTSSPLFYLLLFSILGIVLVSAFTKVNIISFLKAGFAEKRMQDHEKKQVNNNPVTEKYLFFTSLIFLSIICYSFFKTETLLTDFKYVIFILIGFLTLILLKMLFVFLLGKIMCCDHLSKDFLKRMITMYSSLMLILMTCAWLVVASTPKIRSILFLLSIGLMLFMILVRDIKFFKKQISKNTSFIFFFVYLCTIEILAIPLLVKLLYMFDV